MRSAHDRPTTGGSPADPAAPPNGAPTTALRRPRLLVATHSAHKLAELRELLDLDRGELVSLDDLGIDEEPDETGATFETNARIKARFGARRTGLPTLADDSGLEVDALDGGPGVRTRRYAGPNATDDDNNRKLLAALGGLPPERRGARYVCVLALAVPQAGARPSQAVLVRSVRGTTRGRIATEPRGTGGFGYDPIFEPEGEPPGGRTFGQWSAEAKNAVSHRGRAARRMTPILRELGF
jgi:XTP/dITP diphosphohydrolase